MATTFSTFSGARCAIDPNGCGGVTVMIGVATGSRHERSDEAGIAHLLEHVLFRGSRKFKNQASIAKAFADVGAIFNAWTSHDMTVYHARAPASSLNRVLFILSDMVLRPELRDTDIAAEIDIVCEEISRNKDMPSRVAYQGVMRAAFDRHPLGREVAATETQVRALTTELVRDFHQFHYAPDKLLISVAGSGIDVAETRREIERCLGQRRAFGRSAVRPALDMSAPIFHHKNVYRGVRPSMSQTQIAIAYRSLARPHSEAAAMVACCALGGHMNSRLFLALRERENLVYSVSAGAHVFEDAALAVVSMGVDPSNVDRALDICRKEVRVPITTEEMMVAKRMIDSQLVLSEGSETRARMAIESMGAGMSARSLQDQREAVSRVELEDVLRSVDWTDYALSSVGP